MVGFERRQIQDNGALSPTHRAKGFTEKCVNNPKGVLAMNQGERMVRPISHFVLTGKSAVVTGASGDIGRDIVIELARAGVHTVAMGRNQKRLQKTVNDARSYGTKSVALK